MHESSEVKVWDPLVRWFHWTLAVSFFVAYLTGDELTTLHAWTGYLIGGIVVGRVLWGFAGPRYARFSRFVRAPRTALGYAREVLRGRAPRYLGHNPAGGLMIVLLLVALALTSATGLMVYGAEEAAGPLASWFAGWSERWAEGLEEIHELLANLTLLLVAVHVGGVLVESLVHGENLVRAMVTGRKRAGPAADA